MRKLFLTPRCLALPLWLCVAHFVSLPVQAQSSFPPPRAPRPHQSPAVPAATAQSSALTQNSANQNAASSLQNSPSPLTAVAASWAGIPTDFTLEPPDPSGAAGPNGILQTVNLRIAYSDKNGTDIWGPIDHATFFSSVGAVANNLLSDPHTLFDPASGRFYTVLLEVDLGASKSYLDLAVSKTANPTTSGTGDWFFYRIEDTEVSGNTSYWTDYPGLAIDSQAVYVTYNMYSFPLQTASFNNAVIITLDKAAINTGTTNYNFTYANGFTLQPCSVIGSGSPGNVAYFGETLFSDSTHVRVWALSDPLGARTLTSAVVTVPDNGGPPPSSGAPQPGTGLHIDTLDGRTEGNAFWNNGAIWFCTTAGGTSGKSSVYFYKINANGFPSSPPSLAEAGFIDGGAGEWTYQPNIGCNALGDIAMVYCQSSTARFPTIFATTRPVGAANFDVPILIKASPTFYFGGRWGDFASTTADPVNNSFWVTHEWARSTSAGDWGTWWANISAVNAPYFVVVTNELSGGNGNGSVDPNECNQLSLVLANAGSRGAANIQATLSTTNANVIVTGRRSFYPNAPSGTTVTNLAPFQFSTSPNFVCGTPVNFSLVIKSDQFTQTNYFTLPSGSLSGVPLRYNSVGTAPIPDLSEGDLPLVVTNFPFAVMKATLSLHITHTYTSDLTLQLISPDGIVHTLATHVGDFRDNFGGNCSDSRTTFDDDATISIDSGTPPFIGSFKPESPLSVFVGMTGAQVNGTWHLHAIDDVGLDSGTIQCWSLFLSTPACTDGGGECPGSDLAISGNVAPEPVIVGNNLTYNLSITNQGPKAAKGVTLTQLLPASTVYIGASVSQGSFSQSGGTFNANIGNLAVGGVATASITVVPTQSGALTSTASTAAVSDPDPDLSNNSITLTSHVNPPTSDMVIGIRGTPNPVLVGGTLTYTVSVTNNGPSTASDVVVSNHLAATVAVTSATPSQGTATILGNVVIFHFGSMNVGAIATATITVIPSVGGQVIATANVRANQFDPISGNNFASVSTSVSPSADLAVGFQNVPASIVLGNTLSYTVNATNLGPSTAIAVFISQTLPPDAQVISSNSTAGTLSLAGNILTCDVGSMPLGGVVTMTVQVSIPIAETVTSSVNISGGLADAVPANNSATVNTIVALPFINVQPGGATLTSESIVPANGSLEPGEAVTAQFRLSNLGNIATTNLMARLLAGGGVTSPSSSTLVYGALLPGALPLSQLFSFTASGTNGGSVVATLQLSGDVSNTVSFTFQLPKVKTFANTNVIVIPDRGNASPYPSTITVAGVTGLVGRVTATLSNFNHTYPNDVSVLLVSPTGAKSMLMSHAGLFGSQVTGLNLTFDDFASSTLPDSGSLDSGSWQPSAFGGEPVFTNPAPAGPYIATMTVFNGANPNGVWSLFVVDDYDGDRGGISNGWSIAITTISPVNQTADLSITGVGSPNPVLAGDNLTYTFTVTNNGTNTASNIAFTNTLPANVRYLSTTLSQGSFNTNAGKVYANLGTLNVGASATVTIVVSPNTSGTLSSTANVSANQTDLVPANNTATVSTTVDLPVADVSVIKTASTGTAVTGSNLVYTIAVTNNGPGTALNVVVTDPLPAGISYVSASAGVFASGTLNCNLGNMVSGASSIITVTTHPTTVGSVTNTATVATGSTDSNPGNNSSSVITIVRAPAANISAVGARLLSESFPSNNGTVEPGETVSVSLTLTNTGEINTANLVATLANTGGVTASSGSVNYGAMIHNGAAASRTFTFTASPAASGVITATLSLQDGANNLGTVAFIFALPQTNSFANTNAIIIPDHGNAAPYPATITVAGLAGVVSKVSVSLNGLTHAFPKDIGILLVSPSGAKSVVMAGVGSGNSVSNLTLSFFDAAAAGLSDTTALVAGDYKPTSYPAIRTFPSPAPAGAAAASFSSFNGTVPNGDWSLYVVDGVTGDGGIISTGWTLNLTVVSPVNPVADLSLTSSAGPSSLYVGHTVTYSLFVTNNGPSAASGVILTNLLLANGDYGPITVSQGSFSTNLSSVTWNVGSLNITEGAMMTLLVNPTTAGLAVDTALVVANETDLNLADNSTSASVTVLSVIPARLAGVLTKGNHQFQITLSGQPDLTYVIMATTNLAKSAAWKPISTNTAASNGIFQFTDTNAPGLPQRFYRAVVAP